MFYMLIRIIILFLVILLCQFFNYNLSKYWIIKTNLFESLETENTSASSSAPIDNELNTTISDLTTIEKQIYAVENNINDQNVTINTGKTQNAEATQIFNNTKAELEKLKQDLSLIYPNNSNLNASQKNVLTDANTGTANLNNELKYNDAIIKLCSYLEGITIHWKKVFDKNMAESLSKAKLGYVTEVNKYNEVANVAYYIIHYINEYIQEPYKILKNSGMPNIQSTDAAYTKIKKLSDESISKIGDTTKNKNLATLRSVRTKPSYDVNFKVGQNYAKQVTNINHSNFMNYYKLIFNSNVSLKITIGYGDFSIHYDDFPFITYLHYSSNFNGNISVYYKESLIRNIDIPTLQNTKEDYEITIRNNTTYEIRRKKIKDII